VQFFNSSFCVLVKGCVDGQVERTTYINGVSGQPWFTGKQMLKLTWWQYRGALLGLVFQTCLC